MKEQRAWWKEAVIYQIYPRSFSDSNGDGIGDIGGITARLPYIKELGADVIWLSPVYKSPNDDNGYDISDYRDIMDDFGSMEDFDRMLDEAHRLGLKIVMDLVVNHTSDEHPWFLMSRSSLENEKRDWYIWKDGRDGRAPNNWASCFSGSAWQKDEATGQYYLHLFSKKQPDLNWENPRVRDAVCDMMTFWCEKGIDGFRMDVISMISKDQAFPDGETNGGLYGSPTPYVCNGPRVHEFLREMRTRVLSHYDLLTVGEAAGVTLEEAKKYANADGSELNMVFHFEHVDGTPGRNNPYGKWTVEHPTMPAIRAIFNKWQTGLEGKAWNSLYWDNHDQPRAVSRFGNDSEEWRVLSAKMLATCLHMMKGTPYIYQGEELGMTNAPWEDISEFRDIEVINAWKQNVVDNHFISPEYMLACFNAVSRDNARTPMQWDDSPNAGFSTGTPWIKVNPNYKAINAKAALADPDSVFYYYKKLIELRRRNPVIVYGSFEGLLPENEEIYAFQRTLDGRTLRVACNWTDRELPCGLFGGEDEELISNYKTHKAGILQPYEARAVFIS
ncbi:MAG: alpha-glucosidase [Lachnospiraceae bacterium]|nr:alpha-glucosidase [Lachnospiraceae bacterium]